MNTLNNDIVKSRLNEALSKLYEEDSALLENSAHERSVTHKLGEYLQKLFPNFDVDCEYNLDIDNKEGYRKKWVSKKAKNELKERLKNIKSDLNPENFDLNDEINKLSSNFYPDIIIHKRRSNKHNLLIIEAKKKNAELSFDKEKLKAFTHSVNKHHKYNYQLGALVILDVGDNFKRNEFTEPIYFIDGDEKIQQE